MHPKARGLAARWSPRAGAPVQKAQPKIARANRLAASQCETVVMEAMVTSAPTMPRHFGVGLLVGVVAKLLMPGPDPGGWIVKILLGIAGSWVGGFVFGRLGLGRLGGGLVGAVLGAMLLLFVYRLAKLKA